MVGLKSDVQDLRQNRAPETLRVMKERHQRIGIEATDWGRFLLEYSGDVDDIVSAKAADAEKSIKSWKGTPPTSPVDASGAFLSAEADPTSQ